MIDLLVGLIVIIAFMDLAGVGEEALKTSHSMGSVERLRLVGKP